MSWVRIVVGVGGLLGLGGGLWALWPATEAPAWRTAPLVQGPVRQAVTATGTVEPVLRVDVGTQVSGIVAEVLVDFNSRVEAGQVVARIDPALLEADVAAARAERDVRAAEAGLAARTAARVEAMVAGGAETVEAQDAARAALAVADARAQAAAVALDRARRNLGYATIRAPIDGVVVNRAVEPGQTVNAGMSAPTILSLAGDLGRMQIVAAVDESDIGKVHAGQAVRARVQAWPDDSFPGTVRQVRLFSTVVESVVTYAVVVDVENPEGRLLPGMGATLEFVVAEEPAALCAPLAALRFTPEGAPRAEKGAQRVWTVGPDGMPQAIPVEVGISDGRCAVVTGAGLAADLPVITGAPVAPSSGGSPLAPKPAAGAAPNPRRGSF
jgi:HlyD family secretion protein